MFVLNREFEAQLSLFGLLVELELPCGLKRAGTVLPVRGKIGD